MDRGRNDDSGQPNLIGRPNMIKLINLLLCFWKIELIAIPKVSGEMKDSAALMTAQLDAVAGSGEYKRAQALRALMNRHPEAKERECALAIELALCSR